jgi:O-antigen ligase
MSYFLDHHSPDLLLIVLVLAVFVGVVFLFYKKEYLLYLLSFTVPLTLPVALFNGAKLNFPSELICVILSTYICLRILIGYKIDWSFLKHPITLILMIDLVWLLITSVQSSMPEVSYKRFIIRFIYILSYYLFFYELFKLNSKYILIVFAIHCLGLIWPILNTFQHHWVLDFSPSVASKACWPFYNDHTIYGAVLVFFIPFLIYMSFQPKVNAYIKIGFILLLALFCIAAFFSFSRAALASLLLSGIIFLIIKFKVKLIYFIICVVLFLSSILVFQNSILDYLDRSKYVSQKNDLGMHFKSVANVKTDVSNTERINRWICAWKMFQEKPFFGYGPGTYQFFYGQFQSRKNMSTISTFQGDKGHAHSEYLGYLSETGLFGFLNFLLLIGVIISTALRVIYQTKNNDIKNICMVVFLGLITFFIHGVFNGFIETDKMAMPVFVSIAAIVSLDLADRKANKENDVTKSNL